MYKNIKTQSGKVSQKILIVAVLIISAILAFVLYFSGQNKASEPAHSDKDAELQTDKPESKDNQTSAENDHASESEEHDESLSFTAQQMAEQGIRLGKAELGEVSKISSYPAKITANTDRQAHVSPSFSGRVEAVQVELGQTVKKGQALASLFVPELVDQQSNLQIAQSNLKLAQQDYAREQKLWSQGISAQQDFQRASNAVQQANIQVQAARSRLSAYGASYQSNGRFVLTAPISGVISQKDIVIGENVQTASQLFVINQLDELWLEFVLPSEALSPTLLKQNIEFKSLQNNQTYNAIIETLNTEADLQTGRLQVRAKVLSKSAELRPNLMVNVQLKSTGSAQSLRILKSALQQIEQKNVVFVAIQKGSQFEIKAQAVEIGQSSADGQWIEISSGLKAGESYIAQGSFLLKSELEKGDASHGH